MNSAKTYTVYIYISQKERQKEGACKWLYVIVIVLSMEFIVVYRCCVLYGFSSRFSTNPLNPTTSLNIALGHPKTLRHGVGVEFMDKDINGHWHRPLHQ